VVVSDKGVQSLKDEWADKYLKYNVIFPLFALADTLCKGGGKMKDKACILLFFRIKPVMCQSFKVSDKSLVHF